MEIAKTYHRVRFAPEVIREGTKLLFRDVLIPKGKKVTQRLEVHMEDHVCRQDSVDEFFADYRRSIGEATYVQKFEEYGIWVLTHKDDVRIQVDAPNTDRDKIHQVFEVFEEHLSASRLPDPPKLPSTAYKPPPTSITVFIGHGQSSLWRDLKDHLQDKHGYRVEAYETSATTGRAIRDILDEMLNKSSFAILVMTGEDEMSDKRVRARQNVIHEAGLFQGKLGWRRAIVLLEEGVEDFSNIQGIQQIQFSRGNIKETFGEILATLKREFPKEAVG